MTRLFCSIVIAAVALFEIHFAESINSSGYSCGESRSLVHIRVTHGWETDSAMWPWHAAIFRRGRDSIEYSCGATLIGRNFLLTAAHCVISAATGHKLNARLLSVHLGRQHLNETSQRVQEIPVKDVVVHPQFSHLGLKNDIALVSLKKQVIFNDFVQPVCLDKLSQISSKIDDLVGRTGDIVGWGKTENGHLSMTLQTARLPVVDRIACLNSDPQFFSQLISYGMYCAGYENGTSVCDGDSGSGMFFLEGDKWFLRGIVSFSGLKADQFSCDFHKYAGFTNVRYYVPWIRTITNDGVSMIDIFDSDDQDISSRIYTCNNTESSACKLSNIHLVHGGSVAFDSNNSSPTDIIFERSYLQFLPKSLIDSFPSMKYLNMPNLRIRYFEPNVFKSALNLVSLNLQMNRLEEISRDAFLGTHSLASLDLSGNNIEFIDEWAFNSVNLLKSLNLAMNKIAHLPSFNENNILETVNASHNLLSEVREEQFANNKQLRNVYFAYNRLNSFNLEQLDSSSNLETVELSFNQLKKLHIPKHARHLIAQNNSIEQISAQKCILQTLNLSGNRLDSSDIISNCTLLNVLDLSKNQLESFNFESIAKMTKLKSLFLSNNRLFEIDMPSNINLLPVLKILDLSHNRIIHVPWSNAFHKIETINLGHNELQHFDFKQMDHLKEAYLSSNPWDCSALRASSNLVPIRENGNDQCAEGFRKIRNICCKDYKYPYGDTFAAITHDKFIRDLKALNNKKASCPVPDGNGTIDNQSREILENLFRIDQLKNDLDSKLESVLQKQSILLKQYNEKRESILLLKSKIAAIKEIVDHQQALENNANNDSLKLNEMSYLERLYMVILSLVTKLNSSSNALKAFKQYIANIPSRTRQLNRENIELKKNIRYMRQDLTMLEQKARSLATHLSSLERFNQNINGASNQHNSPSFTNQPRPQGNGFYSEHNYHYEHHSNTFG